MGMAKNRGPKHVYVASSWRNPLQQQVVQALAAQGLSHYDFRNPEHNNQGFSWLDVQTDPRDPEQNRETPPKGQDLVSARRFREMLDHRAAQNAFNLDFDALQEAQVVVMILPCGKSAHLELGWAAAAGKPTAILLETQTEPELMYLMADYLAPTIPALMAWLTKRVTTTRSA